MSWSDELIVELAEVRKRMTGYAHIFCFIVISASFSIVIPTSFSIVIPTSFSIVIPAKAGIQERF
jgi:hypothetical protein